jgi:hypothetical protein
MPVRADKVQLFIFESRENRTATMGLQSLDASRYMKMADFPGFPTLLDTINFKLPPRTFFTEHGRFFLHKPLDTREIKMYGECTCEDTYPLTYSSKVPLEF